MVSTVSIFSMVITLLICFGLPIILFIYFYKREPIAVAAVLVGALVFLVSQIFTRIPLLNLFSSMEWYQQIAANIFLLAFFLSVTAGLFEEVGRYLGFKLLLKKHLTWENGVAFGIGHGGIEAIVITGFTYINNLVYSILINSGAFADTIAPQLGPEIAAYIQDQLVNLPSYLFLVAGFERAFTIFIHIALSLVVLLAVVKGKAVYLLFAILLHTAVNFPAVIIPGLGYSILFAELYLLVLAAFSWMFIFRSRGSFPDLPDK
jgi:uncharacterized membrane protein YhfC